LSKPPSSKSRTAPRSAAPAAPAARPRGRVLQAEPKTRAGRPTAARVEAIDRNILAAARETFHASGFEAASMEAIAAAANVSKSTLYSRYAAKDALLRAVVEAQITDWSLERHRGRGPLPSDFKQRLVFHARDVLESLRWDGVRSFERILRDPNGPARDVAKALYETAYQQAVDDLTREIVRGTQDFPAPPRDPVRVAEMLIAMMSGWHAVHDMVRPATSEEANAYAEHAVDVLFAGRAAW
jgi:TetR/AcrR family transcriptional repressor of mexJK operon